jgi:RluA family pseudouridine synthase
MSFPLEKLYEDEDLLAYTKPAGLVTHATLDPSRPNFYDIVRAQLPADIAENLALHHRLDAGTSGVMIFSKTQRMNKPLQELFRTHKISKTYLAITHTRKEGAVIDHAMTIKNFLGLSKEKPVRAISVRSGGKPAETQYTILKKEKNLFVVKAVPRTGRTHQIRAHLSQAGIPLVADKLYGGVTLPGFQEFLLHALHLDFVHPFTSEAVTISSPLPDLFTKVLGSNFASEIIREK